MKTYIEIRKESLINFMRNVFSELPTHARGDGLGFGSQHSYQRRQFVPSFSICPRYIIS